MEPRRDDEHPDPRLDPYRGRAAVLTEDGAPAGYLLVETDYGTFKAGGALWWTRWHPPVEYALVSALTDGELADGLTYAGDRLDEVLEAWAAGTFQHGPTYGVSWLDQAESDRIHREVFGHHHH